MLLPLITSMRLRTLPLSLAGVVCGGFLAYDSSSSSVWTLVFLFLTTVSLQILSNLSNELGDHLSGVDSEGREGPNYSMASGGLTVRQMWCAVNAMVVVCALFGLLMIFSSFQDPFTDYRFSFLTLKTTVFKPEVLVLMLLGAAAIWAATHYTLGKNPYGYRGLGDLFVFIFFGLVSVLGSYYVVAHTIPFSFRVIAPAVGIGLLSVAVLNVNNIRDMASDEGIRRTIPLRIGLRRARIYQVALIFVGWGFMYAGALSWWMLLTALPFDLHIYLVLSRTGKRLDPALPLLVISTFLTSIAYILLS